MGNKKLLGLIGSYRTVGNCEIIVKEIAQRLDDFDLSLVRLPKLSIAPCKGCYACLLPDTDCNLRDDMKWLLQRMAEADALILAVPNYVLGPVGILKMIADRALQAEQYYKMLQDKKTALILTLGREDYRGYADTALIAQAGALGLNVNNMEIFYGTHPGEVALAEDFNTKIKNLVTGLTAGPPDRSKSNRCPRCGCDLFRVRDGDMECALCRSLARLKGSKLDFTFINPTFGSAGHEEHMQWLLMKKNEYSAIKDDLRKIQDTYRQGTWISPDTK